MREEVECQFAGVLKEAFVAIYITRFEEMEAWMEGEYRKRGMDGIDIREWLKLKTKMGGMECSEMCRSFGVWG